MRQAVSAKVGDDTVDLGAVANLVVDTTNGSVSHVVVLAGEKSAEPGKLRALPFKGLGWSMNAEGQPQAMLTMPARAYEALPAFDPSKLDALTGTKAVEAAAKRVGEVTDEMSAEEKAAAIKNARAATAAPSRSVLASKLAGLQVFAASERAPFGTAKTLSIDCTTGTVAFAEVTVADATYLVPFQTLKLRTLPGADGGEPTLSAVVPTNAEGMVGAPTVDAAKNLTAQNPRFRKSVYAHYGVEAPAAHKGGATRKRGEGTREKAGAVKRNATKKAAREVKDVVDKL